MNSLSSRHAAVLNLPLLWSLFIALANIGRQLCIVLPFSGPHLVDLLLKLRVDRAESRGIPYRQVVKLVFSDLALAFGLLLLSLEHVQRDV